MRYYTSDIILVPGGWWETLYFYSHTHTHTNNLTLKCT